MIVVTLLIESKFMDNLAQTGHPLTMLIAFLPWLVFWHLDIWFLWQERLSRHPYHWVVDNRLTSDDNLFDMNAYRFHDQEPRPLCIMFSTTLGLFYRMAGILTALYIVLRLLLPTTYLVELPDQEPAL